MLQQPWAFCEACEQWFHSPEWFDRARPQPVCPACGGEPVAVLMRNATPEPRTRLEGECPRCRRWFDADDWFDQNAPVPCCPDCGLSPCKLAYVSHTGDRVERLLALEFERA